SWAVLKGEKAVRLIRLARPDGKRERTEGSPARREPGTLPEGADPELFEALRQLRRQEAARAGIQPYQVFPDTVLAEFARGRPTTEAAMLRVSGVGEYKLQTFGRLFLNAIVAHCERAGLPT